jgi:hypothetical protein
MVKESEEQAQLEALQAELARSDARRDTPRDQQSTRTASDARP